MNMSVAIRTETPNDLAAIRALTISAFSNSDVGHNGEVDLVDSLRETCDQRLSLVACDTSKDDGSKVVGHILFTPVSIRADEQEVHGMGLAPMSVAPDHQRSGIGSALVTEGLAQLDAADCPFVVVIGHPDFYTRFGFRAAAELKLSHGFDGIPQYFSFIRLQQATAPLQLTGGLIHYHPEFGPQHECNR